MKNKLLLIFFFSGFSSLIYQIVWQKRLSQLIGVDHISVTLIVSLFMLGLGAGGAVGGLLTKKKLDLFKTYFVIEVLLGVFGIFSLYILNASNLLFSDLQQSYFRDYLINFSILFTPTFLMGLSLPIITHIFSNEKKVGELIGTVYSANILGAASGAFITGFFLIGILGMQLTVYLAALINLILGFTILSMREAMDFNTNEENNIVEKTFTIQSILNPLYWLSLCIGFIALAYEIILFRVFTAYFGATSYVFTILIFSYLVMMAIGNRYFGKLADRLPLPSIILLLSSLTVISSLIILYGQDFIYFTGLRQNYLVLWPFRTWILIAQIIPIIFMAMLLMAPVAFLSGFFPAIVTNANKQQNHLGASIGTIYGIQTFGNFAGAFLTGFILLPLMGTVGSIFFLCTILLIIAVIAFIPNFRDLFNPQKALLIGSAIFALTLLPDNFYSSVRLYSEANPELAPQPSAIKESEFGATLGYIKDETSMHVYVGRMFSNSFAIKGSSIDSPDKCFPIDWSLQMENVQVKKALYIGVGTGLGPKCILNLFPDVHLDIVEINPDLVDLQKEYGSDDLLAVLEASNVIIDDGRRYLSGTKDGSYDLIQIGVFNGWCSGCGNIFTEDFFLMADQKLSKNGFLTFNAYPAALKAASNVFKYVNILSPGSSRISDVIASNTNQFSLEKNHKKIIFLEGMNADFVKNGCILNKAQFKNSLNKILSSTDDLPTTEYFLTQRQFTYELDFYKYKPSVDMRTFECIY